MIIGGNINPTLKCYSRRPLKRKRPTEIDSLPSDLLLNILLFLSAPDIYHAARLVCRSWYHLTRTHSFIHSHLQRAPYGLIFPSAATDPVFMTAGQKGCTFELSEVRYDTDRPVWGSCNGLFLEFGGRSLFVSNPVTKQIFVLPKSHAEITSMYSCCMGYADTSMEFKAVITHSLDELPEQGLCAVLTVGVDKSWRDVSVEHLSLASRNILLHNAHPLFVEGSIHWAVGNRVLTLVVETENIKETHVPIPQIYDKEKYTYLSTGRYLSLLIACGDFSWQVWEMNPNVGEWRNLSKIDLGAQKCTLQRFGFRDYDDVIVPFAWLKYPEVLIFFISPHRRRGFMIFVNLVTHEIGKIDYVPVYLFGRIMNTVLVHKNSLVWPDGC